MLKGKKEVTIVPIEGNVRSIEKMSFVHEIKNLLRKVDLQLTTTKDILQEGVDF